PWARMGSRTKGGASRESDENRYGTDRQTRRRPALRHRYGPAPVPGSVADPPVAGGVGHRRAGRVGAGLRRRGGGVRAELPLPAGKFKVCWRDWAGSGYRPQYAFVVRQTVNGRRMTTYDGVAAGQWYDDPEDVTLASYSWQARSCRHNQFPGTGAFALLRDIGGAESYRAVPPLDAGEGTAAGAHRHGGALPLRLDFR